MCGANKKLRGQGMGKAILWAAAGTGFTFLMTALGASFVFFLGKEVKETVQKLFLGFAAGVMIAASVWSLLIPAVQRAQEMGKSGWLEAAGGFLLGVFFCCGQNVFWPYGANN